MKIPTSAALIGAAFASMPRYGKLVLRRALELEQEQIEAESLGLTVQELRLIKAFPEMIDWSWVGKKIAKRKDA